MEIKISKPITYNGKSIITYQAIFDNYFDSNNKELIIAKDKDSKVWKVYSETKKYVGNGMVCEKDYQFFGRDMTLRDAKSLCAKLIEDYIKEIGG